MTVTLETMTQKIPKQDYTAEFKSQAIKRVNAGKSVDKRSAVHQTA
ncbi:hypothetical protein [Thiocystis violacea]|nr:hypothetical protein [Thiocystis violacea]